MFLQHATYTIVFSQLLINGRNEGVHAFICQICGVNDHLCFQSVAIELDIDNEKITFHWTTLYFELGCTTCLSTIVYFLEAQSRVEAVKSGEMYLT